MDLPKELRKVREHLEQSVAGKRDFAHILSYIATESIESVVSACNHAIKMGAISKDMILNILLRNKDNAKVIELKDHKEYYTLKHTLNVDCNRYNSLLKLGGR